MNSSASALLRAYDVRPRKRLGQNFLVDPVALDRIIAASRLSPDDTVVEVGAGLGTLTRRLASRVEHVVAIELDERLVTILHERLADLHNVQIIHGDVLRIRRTAWPDHGYKVVANLPYYITSAILRHFLETPPRPSAMIVTVQREVAERIVAGPGAMSLLAVSVQLYGQPHIAAHIAPGAFYPAPEVDSAVVHVEVAEQPRVTLRDEASFFRVVRAGFGQKRKTLRNALRGGLRLELTQIEAALSDAGVDSRRRAETLSLEEWAAVTRAIQAVTEPRAALNGQPT